MSIVEFTRAYYAMNKMLEDASSDQNLSKRAAVVLLILGDGAAHGMKTSDLVETFQTWYVSTGNTAAKDVSIAKGELFKLDLVEARHGIRNIQLTDEGRKRAGRLVETMEHALMAPANAELVSALQTVPLPKKPVARQGIRKLAKGSGALPPGRVPRRG